MKIRNASLDIVCGVTSALPETAFAEVAFAGKSNVGKSSLINALMNRKSLARTSSQPGKTRTINFYHVEGLMPAEAPEKSEETGETPLEVYLVDLPGYGYAHISEEIKASWGRMIERYLHTSRNLRTVFLLADIRHAPSANDRMMYQWIRDAGWEPVVIATKLDKIKRSQKQKQLKIIREGLEMDKSGIVIPFSAETKEGRDEIWSLIGRILSDSPQEA